MVFTHTLFFHCYLYVILLALYTFILNMLEPQKVNYQNRKIYIYKQFIYSIYNKKVINMGYKPELFELDENADLSDLILQDTRNLFNLLVGLRIQKVNKADLTKKWKELFNREPHSWESNIIEHHYPNT